MGIPDLAGAEPQLRGRPTSSPRSEEAYEAKLDKMKRITRAGCGGSVAIKQPSAMGGGQEMWFPTGNESSKP